MKKTIEEILNKPIAAATIGEVLTAYKKVMGEEVRNDPFAEYPERLTIDQVAEMTGHQKSKIRTFYSEHPDIIAHKGRPFKFSKQKVLEYMDKNYL